jgi:hypothetical protein
MTPTLSVGKNISGDNALQLPFAIHSLLINPPAFDLVLDVPVFGPFRTVPTVGAAWRSASVAGSVPQGARCLEERLARRGEGPIEVSSLDLPRSIRRPARRSGADPGSHPSSTGDDTNGRAVPPSAIAVRSPATAEPSGLT